MELDKTGFFEKQVEKMQNYIKDNGIEIASPVKNELNNNINVGNGNKGDNNKNTTANTESDKFAENGSDSKASLLGNKGKEIEEDVLEEEGEDKEEKKSPVVERIDLDKNSEKSDKREQKKGESNIDKDTESHLEWLKEDAGLESKEIKDKEPKVNYEEEVKTYKTKLKEYEDVLNDEYVKAVIEFRKNGGVDLNQLNAQLGIVDVNKVTIQDFYNQKAVEAGLEGDELAEAVEESVDRYNSLPKLDQKEILNSFKNNLRVKTEEKLKSFSANNQKQREVVQQLENAFYSDLKKDVSDKVGKKWRGLLIDEKMSKEIEQIAPSYAKHKYDENGNFIGYDAKEAVRLAILDKFEKKLMKAQYDLASVSTYDKLIQERNRPSENLTSNQVVVTAPNDVERVTKEWREQQKKKSFDLRGRK